ncbi:endonuclease/exonuclease/phosphatase family protein [Amycolatopsis sp. RTGN1]|uniref:endonuclease/exonuclease/phosphatase family protein n=1 Tax=Amycolatopsis ponsaeliensis TaxID=2992142 RepID=UPI00254E6324|nr:endonuclease/exonuclease/phosphatase family protein [Amycolatopsis sp. RTGN1]
MQEDRTTATVLSWNVAEYIRPGKAAERAPLVEQVLRDERPSVALLQEIYAPDRAELMTRVRSLARETGLECEYEPGNVAAAYGSHDMHAAVLWDPERVSPVEGTWRFYGHGELWHAMVVGTLEIDGIEVSVASYQAPSLGKSTRVNESERLVLAATSGYTRDALIFCGDFNSLSNARTTAGEFYDPEPYTGKDPDPQQVFQCLWDEDPATGEIINVRADRRPAQSLSYGGLLHDAAAALGGTWEPTIGHWYPDGPHGLRRIDLAWVSTAVLPAIVGCSPVVTDVARKASDHLPLRTVVNVPELRTRLASR